MKPKDLIIPFSWDQRRPILLDRLFYIPDYYDTHEKDLMPSFSHEKIFGNANPVSVELCSGNGEWIIEKAKSYPEINWVAVEIRFDRARKIWVKMQNHGLNNLFVVLGDARTFIKYYVDEESITDLYVNFPDPWPKKKHAKHRLVNTELFDQLSNLIHPQGKIILATDDETYSSQMIEAGGKSSFWEPSFPEPHYQLQWPGYGTSFFSSLWQKKGLQIRYMQFEKKAKIGSSYEQ